MNNSDSTMREHEQLSRQAVWLRAMASAAVFGTIGAVIGRWLGKRGNDRETKFAESVFTWSMGSFSGLLAAYSVFKAEEYNKDETPSSLDAHADAPRLGQASPANMALAGALEYDGKIKAHAPQSAIEK